MSRIGILRPLVFATLAIAPAAASVPVTAVVNPANGLDAAGVRLIGYIPRADLSLAALNEKLPEATWSSVAAAVA